MAVTTTTLALVAAIAFSCVTAAAGKQSFDEAAEAVHEAYADAAARGLYADHEPDADGHISHSFEWTSPTGANISLSYNARAHPGVLRLTPANADRFVIIAFKSLSAGSPAGSDRSDAAPGAGSGVAAAWLTVQTSNAEAEDEVAAAKFVVSSRTPIADANAVRLQHSVAAVERLGSGQVRLNLVPATARDLLSEVHSSFEADDLQEVYRMHAAYQARAAGGARLRRSWWGSWGKSVWKYYGHWNPTLFSWNYYDFYSPADPDRHWEKQVYDISDSNSPVDLSCDECYFSVTLPTKVTVSWGKGWGDFLVKVDVTLKMDMNVDLRLALDTSHLPAWQQVPTNSSWSKNLLDMSLPGIPIFSIMKVGIDVKPEFKLDAEVDVDVSSDISASAGMDAHFSKQVVVSLDSRKGHDDVSRENYAPMFTFNRHPVKTSSQVQGTMAFRLVPELKLNLDYLGWVSIKAKPGLVFSMKSAGVDGNDCSSPDWQLAISTDVPSELDARVVLGFKSCSWKSKVYTLDLPTYGPYAVGRPFCFDPNPFRRRRRQEESDATAADNSYAHCNNCSAARPVELGQRMTIDTCNTADSSIWQDTVHSQCRWQDPAFVENGEAPMVSAAHFVLRSDTGHYLISTEGADGQNSSALVQVRVGGCCGTAASCQAKPTALWPQEVVLTQARHTMYLVVSRTDGQCGPVTVHVKRDFTPRFFVDCRVAGVDANATGDITSPYGTVARALEAVADRHAASPKGSGAGYDFPAVVTLLPDVGAGCLHALPVGYRMPTALRGVHLTVRSLNGEKTTATSLYDAHLRRCDATAAHDGTLHTCLSEQQFLTMARGTAYDTRLQPPPSATSASGNSSHLALVGAGAGFVIDAGERVTFIGLGFYNFATAGNGGSIRSTNAEVAVENCMFIASVAGGKGGGIYAQGGNVTVAGSVALESRAAEGGFLAAEDGAGVSVSGSMMAHGDAGIGGGGGLLVRDSHLVLSATDLTGNSAETRGGGLCLEGDLSSAVLDSKVSFTANDAGRYGGAMAAATGATISSSGGMRLERNVAGLAGGAVAIMGEGSRWEDDNSEVNGNAAPAIYALGGGHVQLNGTAVRHSSPVGTSNGYLTPRPGALLCAHGSVQLDTDTQLTNSFDMYANPMNNIGCVDCDGCSSCGECGLCGSCTSMGCDADYGTLKCVSLLGAGATCSEVSGHCQPPSAVSTTAEPTTSTASGAATTTTTVCTGSAASTGNAAESGSGGVHRGYRSATFVLSAFLAVTLAVLAAIAVRSNGRRAAGYKELSYAMYESDTVHGHASDVPAVVEDIVQDNA